jgi:hypothetical protein
MHDDQTTLHDQDELENDAKSAARIVTLATFIRTHAFGRGNPFNDSLPSFLLDAVKARFRGIDRDQYAVADRLARTFEPKLCWAVRQGARRDDPDAADDPLDHFVAILLGADDPPDDDDNHAGYPVIGARVTEFLGAGEAAQVLYKLAILAFARERDVERCIQKSRACARDQSNAAYVKELEREVLNCVARGGRLDLLEARIDLVLMGKLVDTGKRVLEQDGRTGIVWRLADA